MHPASCACRKSLNITNIQDFVIRAQVLWLACSINSTILHFWSPHTSTCVVLTVFTFPSWFQHSAEFCAESRLCSWKIMDDLMNLAVKKAENLLSSKITWQLRVVSLVSWLKSFKSTWKNTTWSCTCVRNVAAILGDLASFGLISLCWTWRSNPVPIKANASASIFLHWFNHSTPVLLACGKILSKGLWQVPATLVFFRHRFPLKWVSRLVSLQSGQDTAIV